MFSSDFPHEVNNVFCKDEIEELLETRVSTQAEKELILAGNADRFYGLSKVTGGSGVASARA